MSTESVLPKGSLVLVTGANGYIGSHVADHLLAAGYRVRGTSRSEEKAKSIADVFEKRHGKGAFEYAVVADMFKEDALTKVLKDCVAVAHVASDTTFRPDPNEVIPPVVAGVQNTLKAAAANPSIKRFVLTSSSSAMTSAEPGVKQHLDANSWNTDDPPKAWAPPPYTPERSAAVYSTSKTEGEKAAWEFMKQQKPSFVLNTVAPNFNIGGILSKDQYWSTAGMLRGMWEGNKEYNELLRNFGAQWFVSVKDVAKLHLAALTMPDVKGERLLGFAEPFTYSDIVGIYKRMDPKRDLLPPLPDEKRNLMTIDTVRSEELLNRYGQSGWVGFEDSVKELLESFK